MESQGVPSPDQASFVLKTSEELTTALAAPQEAVVEVIQGRNQSPIIEEEEIMATSSSAVHAPDAVLDLENGSNAAVESASNAETNVTKETGSEVVFSENLDKGASLIDGDFVLKTPAEEKIVSEIQGELNEPGLKSDDTVKNAVDEVIAKVEEVRRSSWRCL